MEKALLYFLVKSVSVITSIFLLESKNVDITFLVISTLSFACIFLLELLLDRFKKYDKIIMATIGITLITSFMMGIEVFYPLFIVSLAHLLELYVDTKMYYYILGVALLLSIMIVMPGTQSILMVILLLSFLIFCRILLLKMAKLQEVTQKQKETVIELNQKITDMKALTKTLKFTVSIEERNRIAARIHDQLGHGISGSIILLEAAMMIMKDNPEKANATIQKALANLREGVDEIRASLRDERAVRYLIGLGDIKAVLEEFKVNYNKSTILRTSGDMDMISLEVWTCIHDNVKECLTNVLKHSNATEFLLNIEVFQKIIKVEYKDNGSSSEHFEKGIGLDAIEERTVNARGRCFFNKSEKGFCVTNIFTG